MKIDNINRPQHYCNHASGHEAIVFSGHMNFALGNAFKYLYRAGLKGDALEDLKKAEWYLINEFNRRVNRRFVWECSKKYDARDHGPAKVRDMLKHESRYLGNMKRALERIWAAHAHQRSADTLLQALEYVKKCIAIQVRRKNNDPV